MRPHAPPDPALPPAEKTAFGGRRAILGGAIAAGAGSVILLVELVIDPRQAMFAWLVAFAFVFTTALGALIFLMTCHAMNAEWPRVIRRLNEIAIVPMPLLAVLFLPILIAAGVLYSWMDPSAIGDSRARELLAHKAPYLNLPFFTVRAAIYFLIWGVTTELLQRWSLDRDNSPGRAVDGKMRALSAGALPAVSLGFTFAAFDWLMSLTPTWFSTMYGVYVFAGGFVAAIALVTLLTHWADRAGILPGVTDSHYSALGRLLLAFVIFWAYSGFFQFMLIWIANKPIEVPFWLVRMHGSFGVVSLVLLAGHFAVPFAALLSYRLKRDGRALALISVWILAFHYIDVHWLIAPAARVNESPYRWADLGALLALGGASVVVVASRHRGRSVIARNDPSMKAALRYESV